MTVINLQPEGRGKTAESNAPGAFHAFYPAVRTGSSNTGFFLVFFTPPSGRGLVIPVFLFYIAVRTGSSNTRFFFWSWLLAPDLRSVKTILAGNLGSFSVISPEFS